MPSTLTKFFKLSFYRIGMALALGAGLASSAQADSIVFSPQGNGTTFTTSGLGFGPGSAVAVGALPGGFLGLGSTFTLDYQTHLTSLVGVNAVTGLNTTFQVTEVGMFSEVVTGITMNPNGSTTATFALVPGAQNRINIYENNAVTFNDATGKGFTDGTVIATVTPSSFTNSQFTNSGASQKFNQSGLGGNNSGSGNALAGTGSTGINNTVSSTNSSFFITQPLTSSIFNSNLSSVFDAVPPALMFTNPITNVTFTPNIGSVNAQSGPDIEFQVSGFTQSFSAVPEPASVAMTLIGLGSVGLGSFVARRRRARASA